MVDPRAFHLWSLYQTIPEVWYEDTTDSSYTQCTWKVLLRHRVDRPLGAAILAMSEHIPAVHNLNEIRMLFAFDS